MSILEKVESDAREMARQYYYCYIKHHPARIETFLSKTGKWWNYFFDAADKFSRREEYEVESFVKSQFDKKDMIYPPQLKTDNAWETFLEYGYRNIKESEEITLAQSLKNSLALLKGKSVKEFLSDKGNILRLYNNDFEIRALCFSKTFCDFYEENENKFEKTIDINLRKQLVRNYPRLIGALKKRLGEDYKE